MQALAIELARSSGFVEIRASSSGSRNLSGSDVQNWANVYEGESGR